MALSKAYMSCLGNDLLASMRNVLDMARADTLKHERLNENRAAAEAIIMSICVVRIDAESELELRYWRISLDIARMFAELITLAQENAFTSRVLQLAEDAYERAANALELLDQVVDAEHRAKFGGRSWTKMRLPPLPARSSSGGPAQ